MPPGHNRRKLTQEQAEELRSAYARCRLSTRQLARRYGISQPTAYYCAQGWTYKV